MSFFKKFGNTIIKDSFVGQVIDFSDDGKVNDSVFGEGYLDDLFAGCGIIDTFEGVKNIYDMCKIVLRFVVRVGGLIVDNLQLIIDFCDDILEVARYSVTLLKLSIYLLPLLAVIYITARGINKGKKAVKDLDMDNM
jgi:hypothetical protein